MEKYAPILNKCNESADNVHIEWVRERQLKNKALQDETNRIDQLNVN
jgi:hypothetical protein